MNKDNIKILTICPSYRRPKLAESMVNSYKKTISNIYEHNIVLGLDIGDDKLSEYNEIDGVTKIICRNKSTITEIINSIYRQFPDYDLYHITNDDVEYLTPGWDIMVVSIFNAYGEGIFYGNDLIQGENLCTFPIISSSIIKKIGWLQLPSLNRYCGDVVWKHLGQMSKCLYYIPNAIIMHKWNGKVNEEVHIKDKQEFAKWLPESYGLVEKINEVATAYDNQPKGIKTD